MCIKSRGGGATPLIGSWVSVVSASFALVSLTTSFIYYTLAEMGTLIFPLYGGCLYWAVFAGIASTNLYHLTQV